MTKRFKPEEYPVVIKRVGEYLWAYNLDFELQHHERLTSFSDQEKVLQTARLILGIQSKIHEKIAVLDRNQKEHPIPLRSDELLKPKVKDGIPIKEAAALMGEAIHNIRRMADEGELKTFRTRKGHRRFSRSQIEALLIRRQQEILSS
jgi:excisionase family DNA binding protein